MPVVCDIRLLAVPLLVLLSGCGDRPDATAQLELTGSTMGTTFNIKLVTPPAELDEQSLQRRIEHSLLAIEQQMSTYLPDSELSRFNTYAATDWFEVSSHLCEAIAVAQSISAASNGAFDVTVGPLVNLWGFGPDGAVTVPPTPQHITSALAGIGYQALHFDCSIPAIRKDRPELYVDLSAFAKGYAVDVLAVLLEDNEIANYLVEVGGELRMGGKNSQGMDWAIAIEDPLRSGRSVHSVVNLTDGAVATSGDYRNYFEYAGNYYSHTIDPGTGYPVTHNAASVTVIADTAAFADAYATALLVLGPSGGPELAEREGIAAYFLLRDDTGIVERATTLFVAEAAEK